MVIFNSYVKLPEGTNNIFLVVSEHGTKTSPKRGHLHEESDDPNSNGGFFECSPEAVLGVTSTQFFKKQILKIILRYIAFGEFPLTLFKHILRQPLETFH
jgi:hypothetical protein